MFARQVQSGTGNELRVWFSPEAKNLIFPPPAADADAESDSIEEVGSSEHEVGYVVHDARDSADIAVELAPNPPTASPEVIFCLCNSQAKLYGVSTLRRRKPARREDVEPILFAAAKWNWHLHRTNENSEVKDIVGMEMMKIGEKTGKGIKDRKFLEEPYTDLSTSGVVDFTVKSNDLYGAKLTNTSNTPLYVRMFYFDTTDFAICEFSCILKWVEHNC